MGVELRYLYYFLMVAREGNITRAANKLHLTQPTLSRQIMALEESVGTPLIIRGKRKIELTEAGMLLRSRAEEILNIVQKTEKDLLNHSSLLEGEIGIGMVECEATHTLIPELLKTFNQNYPGVTFDLYTGNADLIKERIENGILDIGVLLEPVSIDSFDFVRLPKKEKWGMVTSTSSPLVNHEGICSEDLKNHPILCTKRVAVQNEIASWAKTPFEELHVVATYNLISNALSLVSKGIGNVITIEGALYHHKQEDIQFIPFEPNLETGVVLAWKKQRVMSPALAKFIELIYHTIDV